MPERNTDTHEFADWKADEDTRQPLSDFNFGSHAEFFRARAGDTDTKAKSYEAQEFVGDSLSVKTTETPGVVVDIFTKNMAV